MADFPEEMEFIIVEDVFPHYEIGIFELVEVVHVYCEWCDKVIATFNYDEVVEMNRAEFHEAIIEAHIVSDVV